MRTFVCRLIFCAKITDSVNITQFFRNVIKKHISLYITGLLFIYSDFIIHLIEASEYNVFQFCHEICTISSEIMTDIKCLYIQNNGKKRFFDKWYYKRMDDHSIKNEKLKKLEDNFETVSAIYEVIILNLCKLYIELWNTRKIKNYESFIEYLDLISVKGHLNIPSRREIEFVFQSSWVYNLRTLTENYCNLNYNSNFNDHSSVSEMIQEINYNYNK